MNERAQVAWLARRAAFGLAPGDLQRLTASGVGAFLDSLVDPGAHGIAPSPDPWEGLTFTNDPQQRRAEGLALSDRWLHHMATTPRPLEEAMVWFWHDHFAVSYEDVRSAIPFSRYLTLLRRHALGDFRKLIADITVDAAMLLFLDGATSTAAAPNENYGRELQELYTIGIGPFTEADVRAAAVALTGYTVRARDDFAVAFVRTRHATTPQTLLGRSVSDVASVVDAVVDHPACAPFIAAKLASWFLGPDYDASLVAGFAKVFRDANMAIAPLMKAILRAGLDGAGGQLVLSPVPWLVATQKALGVRLPANVAYNVLNSAGQAPLNPPNVGGWPGASAWLGSSATVARVSMASALVDALPATSSVLKAAAAGDLAVLAELLGLPDGFTAPTAAALAKLAGSKPTGKAGAAVTAVALSSPELLVV